MTHSPNVNNHSDTTNPSDLTVCRFAKGAAISGLLSLGSVVVAFLLSPYGPIVAFLPLALFILTIVLGIIGLVKIHSHPNLIGQNYAIMGMITPPLVIIMLSIFPVLFMHRCLAFRMTCGTNLAGIGKSMLIYANDYEGKFPKAGGHSNHWTDSLGGHGSATHWLADIRRKAYGIEPRNNQAGNVTVSSNLYLLVKYAEVTPKSFICKGELDSREFRLEEWLPDNHQKELTDLWDFGYFINKEKNQSKHVAYSYHHPFGSLAVTSSNDPNFAIMADRSPWFDQNHDRTLQWAKFTPDLDPNVGNAVQAKAGNAKTHHYDGQNILFMDSHVSFEKRSFVGIDHDNIYTVQDPNDPYDPYGSALGRRPIPYNIPASTPRSRHDSVLVQENGKASSNSPK